MGLILTRLLKQNRFSSAGMKFLFQKPDTFQRDLGLDFDKANSKL